MKKNISITLLLLSLFCLNVPTIAQEVKKPLEEITIEDVLRMSYDELLDMPFEDLLYLATKLGVSVDDLLNMQISVSSKELTTLREQPGIVTVITGSDVEKAGARDLQDILQMVPGFFIGYDVGGVVGAGLRGNWAQEGKILLQIDGIDFNDLMYNSLQLGNHFPVEQIERIEIVRGPGSSIYGGCAELGVINIITKTGEKLNGGYAGISYGKIKDTYGRKNASIAFGKKIGDLEFNLLSYVSEANKSSDIFDNIYYAFPDTLRKGDGYHSAKNFNISLKYKGLSLRYLFDYYNCTGIEDFVYVNQFTNHIAEIQYEAKLSDKFSITPKFVYRQNKPWYMKESILNTQVTHYDASLLLRYNPNENINLLLL